MLDRIDEAVAYVRARCDISPEVGIVLGSGLGALADHLETTAVIPFAEVPHAAASSVVGHAGRLIAGRAGALPLLVMQGRVHYYEGHSMEDVLFLPRVLARLGIRRAIVTNAAGGVNTAFSPGDLMLISDHINFIGENPLRGPNLTELGARFPDMSEIYSAGLRRLAREVAEAQSLPLREGVYLATAGPTYETPAEIRAIRLLGADAVGMSTVPEATAFSHMNIPVLGISCITNMAAGILQRKLHHDEVLETTTRVQEQFVRLVLGILERMAEA